VEVFKLKTHHPWDVVRLLQARGSEWTGKKLCLFFEITVHSTSRTKPTKVAVAVTTQNSDYQSNSSMKVEKTEL
jgi:hypothetical protein